MAVTNYLLDTNAFVTNRLNDVEHPLPNGSLVWNRSDDKLIVYGLPKSATCKFAGVICDDITSKLAYNVSNNSNENIEREEHPPLASYDKGNRYTEQNKYRVRSVLTTGKMFIQLSMLGFPFVRNLNAYVGEYVYWSLGKQIDDKTPAFYRSPTRIGIEGFYFYIGKVVLYDIDMRRVVISF